MVTDARDVLSVVPDANITGRAKDVVVKNGVNYAAEDLETTVEQLRLESLHANGCAAFSHDDGLREQLVIVSEIARDTVAEWSEVADPDRRCCRDRTRDARPTRSYS